MYSAFDHWAYWSHMLTAISMFSPCAQWVFGPLSPVSVLVNPVRGQCAIRSTSPNHTEPNIFHARHPYKPSGDHQGISLPISELHKQYFWRHWAQSPGNPYRCFVKGSLDSEGSSADILGERGEDEGDRVVCGSGSGS